MSEELGITTKKEEDPAEWYREVVIKSGLADYSSVGGCIVFKPRSYSIWEKVRKEIDRRFHDIGIENAYFPLFIPEKLLEKEAEHFEGFTPEVAWVTRAGSSDLDERLAIRPTSEAIMYDSYKDWVRSWRDLPLKINQWNNVVRWEFKHATPFLRTREFLWQEGHCAYATDDGVLEDKERVLDAYQEVCEDYLAIPCVRGRKTEKEKFSGAVDTYSLEHLLPDGKAIQGPTYHNDGTNFAKAFDITYTDEDGEEKYVRQSTFGFSTRQIGTMIMMHSDDRGLVVPPKVAPTRSVIVPIYHSKDERKAVMEVAEKVHGSLERCKMDDRENKTPGWKFNEWEVKGVPIRIEIGPSEAEEDQVTIVRRDTGEKKMVSVENVEETVEEELNNMQKSLFKRATELLEEGTQEVRDYDDLVSIVEENGGFVKAPWCGKKICEEIVKDDTSAKITNIPFMYDEPDGEKCIRCGDKAKHWVNFAKSY